MLIRSRLLYCLVLTSLFHVAAPCTEPKSASQPRTLSQKIESILRSNDARRGHWGIEVIRLSDGKVLYSRNAEQLFLPASNMKLFTTAAAIEKLGTDFRFRTTVEADTDPTPEGKIGDLYLVGRGDPFLGYRIMPGEPRPETSAPPDIILQQFAESVVSKGIVEVMGNVIADDTHFVYEPFSRGWEEDDLIYGYAAPVTALAFNDNSLLIRYSPGAAVGEWARIETYPFTDFYSIKNRLRTAPERTPTRIHLERRPGSRELEVWGEIALDASPREDAVSVEDPPRWAAELFRRALEARGVRVKGNVEVRHLSRAEAFASEPGPPASARLVLAENISKPLAEDIKLINKLSHNLHAEMLLRTLGKEVKGEGSLKAGIEVLEEFSKEAGIEDSEAVFSDGSGLSRHSIIAPRAMTRLLRHVSRSPHFSVFLESLPIAGVDGTLDHRFQHSPARGNIRAKTGTLEHVNTLSGYIYLPSGQQLAFSVMGNEHPMRASRGKKIVDRIAIAIYEHFAGWRRAKAKDSK